ncbi:MAG: proteasome assembly chaperone family protein [Halobacteria archaeon]
MDEIEVIQVNADDVEVEDPVFVEGLPGVGHVGKLVVEHLIEEFDSTVMYRIYSQYFPPQSSVDEDGVAEIVHAEIHYCDVDGKDVVVLSGDHQSQTIDGHYKITEKLLEIAKEVDVEKIYTLGGVATGEMVEEYEVLGAANEESLVEELGDTGVKFGEGEPSGGIIGVSGLLLGLGELRGFPAVCLMGQTSGYIVDPKSAKAVLKVLMQALDFEVDMSSLEERAEDMEEVVKKLEDMNREVEQMPKFTGDDDLRYIG